MTKKEKKEPKEKALETEETILEEKKEKFSKTISESAKETNFSYITNAKRKKNTEKKEGYFKLLRGQLKMVKWPSGKEMFKYTFSTIVFILLFVLFFQLIDVISSFVKGLF